MDNQEASLWPTNDRMKKTVNKSELKRERVTEFNGWLTSLPVDDMVYFHEPWLEHPIAGRLVDVFNDEGDIEGYEYELYYNNIPVDEYSLRTIVRKAA